MEFKQKLKVLGLKKKDLASRVGVRPYTISRWKDSPPRIVDRYLDMLLEVKKLADEWRSDFPRMAETLERRLR